MGNDQRMRMDIIKPHRVEGVIVLSLGLALLSHASWAPPSLEAFFSNSKVNAATLMVGVPCAAGGLWRMGWCQWLILDAERRQAISFRGLFGIGKREKVDFDEIRYVRLKRELQKSYSGTTTDMAVYVSYPISLEGPAISVDAGWSSYHEESRMKAESIAEFLQVELHEIA